MEMEQVEPKSAEEIARRVISLFACFEIAAGADKTRYVRWLEDKGLATDLSPRERAFIQADHAHSELETAQQIWGCEAIIVLLWALDMAEMPSADEHCRPDELKKLIPTPSGRSVDAFLAEANIQPEEELRAEAERIWQVHWEARDDGRHNRQPRRPVNLNIVERRHRAINWIVGDEDWDNVTTDT